MKNSGKASLRNLHASLSDLGIDLLDVSLIHGEEANEQGLVIAAIDCKNITQKLQHVLIPAMTDQVFDWQWLMLIVAKGHTKASSVVLWFHDQFNHLTSRHGILPNRLLSA